MRGVAAKELLVDLAVLSPLSVAVHYFLGIYGIAGALLVLGALEHGDLLLNDLVKRMRLRLEQLLKIALGAVAAVRNAAVNSSHTAVAFDESDCEATDGEAADDEEDDEDRAVVDDFSTVRSESTDGRDSSLTRDDLSSVGGIRRSEELARLVVRDVGSRLSRHPDPEDENDDRPALLPRRMSSAMASRMQMNSREPIAFENDLFVGKAYFLVRTNPEDPYWSHLFVGRRRMFWIQVQGQFKRPPTGTVFLGGELPSQISPGIFTRSIAMVIMGLIHKLVGRVNWSFGDSRNAEVPSVSFPLYQSVDQFMATPTGEVPPPLGREDFGETEEARRERRQTPVGSERYTVGTTYSFHFHTMYVDLTQWKTANLPGLSEMDLSAFFDSLPLRLVAYDIVPDATTGKHFQASKDYLFGFEVAYDHQRLWRSESENSEEESTVTSSNEITGMNTMLSETSSVDGSQQVSTVDQTALINAENSRKLGELTYSYLFWMEELEISTGVRRVHYVFSVKRKLDGKDQRLAVVSAFALRQILTSRKNRHAVHNAPVLPVNKLRFHSQSRIGSYSTITDEARHVCEHIQHIGMEDDENDDLVAGLSFSTVASFVARDDEEIIASKSALYQCLTQRTHLQAANSTKATCSPSKLGVNMSKRDREDLQVSFEGVVYRYYSECFVRQEVLFVTADELHFYRSYSSSPDKIVHCSRVIGVQASKMPFAEGMDDAYAFVFQINTFAEEIVLCVGTEHARNSWIRVILQHCNSQVNFDRSLTGEMHICYAPSTPLRPANRVVLNGRSLFPSTTAHGDRENTPRDALATVTQVLRRALHIYKAERVSVVDTMDFLNDASTLRSIDVNAVHNEYSHEAKLSFYLNLYHAILAHAMISHGYPRGKSQWAHFQTHMCYTIGLQQICLSLAEIEHVILRGRLQQAELPHLGFEFLEADSALRASPFAIAHPDFRLSFALVMNQQNSEEITIFEAECVHDQLNHVAKKYVAALVEVFEDRNTIYLPKICEWYRFDFGGNGSPLYCVRKLLGFLPEEQQEIVLRVVDSPLLIHIKYRSFSYTPKTTLHQDISFARQQIGS